PAMAVQMLTVVLNAILAPILIAGWLTGHPLGTAGAGLATSIAVGVGVVLLWGYFVRLEHYVGLDAKLWRPAGPVIRRILNVGLPAGGEFFMMFVIMAVVYWAIRGFGPPAQAGFGIGSRVMQALFLPVMALAFAVAPVAGQNMGARAYPRVRESFNKATLLSAILMFALTLACQWRPEWFVRLFTDQDEVVEVGATYLRVISWNFVATGVIFSCSGLFQALGNTVPSLLSSASRVFTYLLPVVWLSRQPGFRIITVWHLSVATVTLQALLSYLLLRREFGRKLPASAAGVPADAASPPAPDGAG
ncbi:MAG TPA: MATE family efflux transporter, partial [Steroidobacteraceae bacterium]